MHDAQRREAILARTPSSGGPSTAWRKYAAVLMVVIMAASAFVMVAPMASEQPVDQGDDVPVQAQAEGDREVTYTISHIGESYLKDSSTSAMGRHGDTPGLSEWWEQRRINYGDTIIHNAFPYGIGYMPYSAYTAYSQIDHAGYIMVSFARFEIDAKNVPTIATGPDRDPILIPVLKGGPTPFAGDGGEVNFNWYATYITTEDVNLLKAGTHYANSYYGVPIIDLSAPASYANEGWYFEHHGTMTFDRLGANKFLNLAAAGDLRTEFNTANSDWTLSTDWANHWDSEGNGGAIYDIYACYDYSTDPVKYWLTLDPSSTYDQLVVRMWGYSWGMDGLLLRFMDVTGLMTNFQPWPEDWYLNGTITSTDADIQSRMVTFDHMTSWIDYGALKKPYTAGQTYVGAWTMEPGHADWTYSVDGWQSRYNPYNANSLMYRPGKSVWAPGSNYYGTLDTATKGVAYWVTPNAWDLVAGEKIVVKLADAFWAVKPYKGVANEDFSKGGSTVKVAEVLANGYWGEMVLGHGPDSTLYCADYYDPETKTLTYTGPMNFADQRNTKWAKLNQTGSPLIITSVSRISDYSMRIVEPGPYLPGTAYTLEVTAKNYTGVTLTDWNGTANLSVVEGGAILGSPFLQFWPDDFGVNTTTIQFTTGSVIIEARDYGFPLDVFGELVITTDIPEFPTLLIPVIGAAAVFVAFRRRKST